MKIAFLGFKDALDYFHIGGVESFLRRLSSNLIQNGDMVYYICYGSKEEKEVSPRHGLALKYFQSFKDALDAMGRQYDHVIPVYLQRKDRLQFISFRRKYSKDVHFHFIYFGWPNSLMKRKLYFSEARLFPYNGKLFCISQRQYEYVMKWAQNANFIFPPVPEDYFLKSQDKPHNHKLKITYLGRIDPGKGTNEAIDIFKSLMDSGKFEFSIYGIHISEHSESLEVHNRLKKYKEIRYIEVDRQKYSPEVDDFVRDILKETDVFIQPYHKLSSAIDTPLLLLEAMASLCAVITKPLGNIPDIYGKSKFLIQPRNFVRDTIELLKHISSEDLEKERERIYQVNNLLNFSSANVSKRFINALAG